IHIGTADRIAAPVDTPRTGADDEFQARVRHLSFRDRNIGVADLVGLFELGVKFVPSSLFVCQLHGPYNLRGMPGRTRTCAADRQLAEVLSCFVTGVYAEARGLPLKPIRAVLETARWNVDLARIAGNLGADEILRTIADARDADAGMNLASTNIIEWKL